MDFLNIDVWKVFLKNKLSEVWGFLKSSGEILLGILIWLACMFVFCFVISIWQSFPNHIQFLLGFSFLFIFVSAVLSGVSISLLRWLGDNWRLAVDTVKRKEYQ